MEELISPWMGYASIPMYDDGVITWWANKKSEFFGGFVDGLEKDLGINFERVESKRDADIRHKRVKHVASSHSGKGSVLGQAKWNPSDRIWKLKSLIGDTYDSTVIHELGHALGLGHPEDHNATKNTVMSYSRDRSIKRFYFKDLQVLNTIYIENDYVLQDVIPEKIKIDMISGICHRDNKKSKKKDSITTVDVLTGIHHVDYI